MFARNSKVLKLLLLKYSPFTVLCYFPVCSDGLKPLGGSTQPHGRLAPSLVLESQL